MLAGEQLKTGPSGKKRVPVQLKAESQAHYPQWHHFREAIAMPSNINHAYLNAVYKIYKLKPSTMVKQILAVPPCCMWLIETI